MKITNSDYRCIVIDNISKSKDIRERVFWYKAELHPAFRVGCKKYWQFHKNNYQENVQVDEAEAEARARVAAAKQRKKRRNQLQHHQKFAPTPLSHPSARIYANPALNKSSNVAFQEQPLDANQMIEQMVNGKQRQSGFEVVAV